MLETIRGHQSPLNILKLYQAICNYYPIGIHHEQSWYQQYPGVKALNKIQSDKFDNPDQYPKWQQFIEAMDKDLSDAQIEGNTMAIQPSLGGSCMLHRQETDNFFYAQELYFYVSLLGPFYTIFGKDYAMIKGNSDAQVRDAIPFDPVFITSPLGIYEECFHYIEKKLQAEYEDYTFVPHRIGSLRFRGLSLPFLHKEKDGTIHQALFNAEDFNAYKFKGDENYGVEHWRE